MVGYNLTRSVVSTTEEFNYFIVCDRPTSGRTSAPEVLHVGYAIRSKFARALSCPNMNPNGVIFSRSESPQIEYNVSGSTMQLSIMDQYTDSGSAPSGSRRQGVVGGGVTPVVAGSYENAPPVAAGSSAPMLNIQGIPFQGAYMPNPNWQFFAPDLPPQVERSDRGDAEFGSAAPSKRSSQTHISQEPTSLQNMLCYRLPLIDPSPPRGLPLRDQYCQHCQVCKVNPRQS